jgi:glycosyltransferase involved in cell wall biosynthesis
MKILIITRLYYPHIGGVEKHIFEVAKRLKVKSKSVTVLTEKYDKKLKETETVDGIRVVRFSFRHIRFLGLLSVWRQIFKNRKLIQEADVVHIHDVFIWYLPFRFLYAKKPVFTTIHGWEERWPMPILSIIQKQLAARLSNKTVGVGKFLEKYLRVTFNKITYGGVSINQFIDTKNTRVKIKNWVVYVGRLEENTGILNFLKWLKNKNFHVDFCGDGSLRKECEKYGTVHGFCDPNQYYKKAEYCVPGGYLAALEALSYGCKLKLFWNNKIKEDYWKMSPFVRKDVRSWAKKQTWDKLADEYLDLYNHIK